MEGWIKLHRKLLEWEWYDDINVCRLFVHCLLKANHKENTWRGVSIKKGSFISSYKKLSDETGLSIKQIRNCLTKLKRTNELTHKGTTQYTVFTVVSYDSYQEEVTQKGKRGASKGQTEGKQRATNKNDKKEKNDKNDKKEEVITHFPDDYILNEKYIEFIKFRKEIKKPVAKASFESNKKKLMNLAGNDSNLAIEIIDQSIANGWQGFFNLKNDNNNMQKPKKIGSMIIPEDFNPDRY